MLLLINAKSAAAVRYSRYHELLPKFTPFVINVVSILLSLKITTNKTENPKISSDGKNL